MGQHLGRYTLLRRLATGGMGDVYLAAKAGPVGFGPLVAVKVLRAELSNDREFVEMLADEANISMFLNHQNIVSVLDLGEHDGLYFIAMEYVRGVTAQALADRLASRGESLDPPLALFVAGEVARALRYAHARVDASGAPLHIVHRDVTPGNILLSVEGEVKLTDFGIARARGRIHETRAGVVKGKFGYMAPELVRGDRVDQRADVFCLGVSTYLLLTGRHPAADRTVAEAADLFERGAVEPPSRVAMVPPQLDALVLRALAPDPADRWPTAAAFGEALQDALLASPAWRARAGANQLAAVLAHQMPEAAAESIDAEALARLETGRSAAPVERGGAAPVSEQGAPESPTQIFDAPRTDPETALLDEPELWEGESGPVAAAPGIGRARDADGEDDEGEDADRTIVGMSLHDVGSTTPVGPFDVGAVDDGDELFDDDTFAPSAVDDDATRLGIFDADVTRAGVPGWTPPAPDDDATSPGPDSRRAPDPDEPADDRTEIGFSVDLDPPGGSSPEPAPTDPAAEPVLRDDLGSRGAARVHPGDASRRSVLPELGEDEPLPALRRPASEPRVSAGRTSPPVAGAWSDDADARRLLAGRFDAEVRAPDGASGGAPAARLRPAVERVGGVRPTTSGGAGAVPSGAGPGPRRRLGAVAAWSIVVGLGLALVGLAVFTDVLWPRLVLESEPSGAQVRVDGRLRGRTPLTVRVAPRRKHRVDFEKEGFAPAAREITGAIREGRSYPVRVELQALPTVFLAPPVAEVWVDGVNVGRGPRVVLERLPAQGPIEVVVRAQGYEPWFRTFDSVDAVPLRFDVTLREKP
jgi:hypothetical protein